MKKIIGGKKYDTETAKEIKEYENDYGRSDFRFLEETLYQKKNGEFFLAGSGGPLSKYAVSCGSGRSSGEAIIPLSHDEAMEWCEAHLDVDEYEALFGEVEE